MGADRLQSGGEFLRPRGADGRGRALWQRAERLVRQGRRRFLLQAWLGRRAAEDFSLADAVRFFRAEFFEEGLRLCSRAPRSFRGVLEAYLTRLDIENLKILARGQASGLSGEQMRGLLVSAERAGGLPVPRLARARGLVELAQKMPGRHPFSRLLDHAATGDRDACLVQIELAAQKIFWDEVMRNAVAHLEAEERFRVLELLGLRADLDAFFIIRRGLLQGLAPQTVCNALPAVGRAFPCDLVHQALTSTDCEANLARLFPEPVASPCLGEGGEAVLVRRLWARVAAEESAERSECLNLLAALLRKELEGRVEAA